MNHRAWDLQTLNQFPVDLLLDQSQNARRLRSHDRNHPAGISVRQVFGRHSQTSWVTAMQCLQRLGQRQKQTAQDPGDVHQNKNSGIKPSEPYSAE